MKSIPIRTLKHDTRRVLERVSQGETMEIRRRNKRVATLSPCASDPVVCEPKPDYLSRLKKIYPDDILTIPASELLAEERGER